MGLEAYLFKIKFQEPVPEQELVDLFEKVGMMHLKEKFEKRTEQCYGSFFFELRSERGLTESHCLLAPKDKVLCSFYLRFSVVSPHTVIDQSFELLQKMNVIRPILIYDTEIKNHVYRQLRKDGKINDHFSGLEGTEEEAKIETACYIDLDVEQFKRNELGIAKRQLVIENVDGEVIESGSSTIEYLEKNGLFGRFIAWIKREL